MRREVDRRELSAWVTRAAEAQHLQHARLDALLHFAVAVLEERGDLQNVFDKALAGCLTLTDSQFGFIGLTNDDRSAMDVVAIQGFEPAPDFYSRFYHIPLRPTILCDAAVGAHPVRSDDTLTDPRRVGTPRGHPPVRSFLGIPLRAVGKPIGMIGVANRPDRYGEEDEQLLCAFASHVALAIYLTGPYLLRPDHDRLEVTQADLEREVAQRTAELTLAKQALSDRADQLQLLLRETLTIQERERARISLDIHDGVNQLIIAAMFEVKAARERLHENDVEGVDRAMSQVRSIMAQVDQELRRIIVDLRPPTLDDLGLAHSIARYVEQFQTQTGILCAVEVRGQPTRLPEQVEIGVYRILQEALNNVSRHAGARTVRVRLTFSPAAVALTVADDGRGFDSQVVRQAGQLGLLGLQERAASLGGRLRIASRPGRGTAITLRVPLGTAPRAS